MSQKNISLQSIVQRPGSTRIDPDLSSDADPPPQPVILITYRTTEAEIRQALDLIGADNVIDDTPQLIRIEKLL